MHSQFIKEFKNVIYRLYNDNVIVIRKKRRVKKLFEIFVKHTFLYSLIVILKEINLFSNHSKNLLNHRHRYFYSIYSNNIFIRLKTITLNVFNLIAIIIYKFFNIDFDFNFNK